MANIAATVLDAGKALTTRVAANDDTIVYAPGRCLVVVNGNAATCNVQVATWFDKSTTKVTIAAVPTAATWYIPLTARMSGSDGTIDIDYSVLPTVTVGAIDFPRIGQRVQQAY